jgi:hypothetical protein
MVESLLACLKAHVKASRCALVQPDQKLAGEEVSIVRQWNARGKQLSAKLGGRQRLLVVARLCHQLLSGVVQNPVSAYADSNDP